MLALLALSEDNTLNLALQLDKMHNVPFSVPLANPLFLLTMQIADITVTVSETNGQSFRLTARILARKDMTLESVMIFLINKVYYCTPSHGDGELYRMGLNGESLWDNDDFDGTIP